MLRCKFSETDAGRASQAASREVKTMNPARPLSPTRPRNFALLGIAALAALLLPSFVRATTTEPSPIAPIGQFGTGPGQISFGKHPVQSKTVPHVVPFLTNNDPAYKKAKAEANAKARPRR